MQLQTKALYNLLRFTSYHNKSLNVQKWQIEDLREEEDNKLFENLSKFKIKLDLDIFLKYLSLVESPEEMTNIFASDRSPLEKDEIYLTLFELFRRYAKSKRSISIFCDELDHRIFLYDNDLLDSDEPLQNSLANLKTILDSTVDLKISHKAAFENILNYFAHDLENFLFDYILELIEVENDSYAQELLDWFHPYVNKKLYFDFLKAKIKAKSDIAFFNQSVLAIHKALEKKPNLDLIFIILRSMVDKGDIDLFEKIVKSSLKVIQKEDHFQSLLQILANFYLRLDKEDLENKILDLIEKRSKFKKDQILQKEDINSLLEILE